MTHSHKAAALLPAAEKGARGWCFPGARLPRVSHYFTARIVFGMYQAKQWTTKRVFQRYRHLRDQKAAGSNPATSTRRRPGMPQMGVLSRFFHEKSGRERRVRPYEGRQKQSGGLFLAPRAGGGGVPDATGRIPPLRPWENP